MFYVASGAIAADHREVAESIRALDHYLHKNEGNQVRLGFAADILRIKRDVLGRLLRLYEGQGVVKEENAYICDSCDGFMTHRPGEGDLWCDICDKSASFRGAVSSGKRSGGWCPRLQRPAGRSRWRLSLWARPRCSG